MDSCCNSDKNKQTLESKNTFDENKPNQEFSAFHIPQMDCPTEIALIQEKLEGLAGIESLKFELEKRSLIVKHGISNVSPELIAQLLDSVGLKATIIDKSKSQELHKDYKTPSIRYFRLAMAGIFAIAAEICQLNLKDGPSWVVPVLAYSAILLSGVEVYKKGIISLSKIQLNINALMSIAVTGALIIGQWPEASMVMVLFAVAELIEAKAFDRARNAFKSLLELAPDITTVKMPSGTWEKRPTKDVAIDSFVRVRPGEKISLDGLIVTGSSSINQAPITGESIPVEKTVGDKVFAGTINETAEIEFKVSSLADQSTLARIVETIDSAQSARAPTQRFIDRFSKFYTPAVFFIALIVATMPPLLLDGHWFEWIYKSLVLLVIACPCALVISTPVTIISGLSGAAKHGILIKGGVFIEKGARLKVIALDKTGTITFGKPHQTDFKILNGFDYKSARSIAASLAARSDHPISQAIALKAKEDGIQAQEVISFEALGGRGTKGVVKGEQFFLANHRFIEELKICSTEVEEILEKYERDGKTVAILATSTRVVALICVIDTVRPSSQEAVTLLHDLGIKTVMLSGDNQLTANKIALEVGIDEAKGTLLPEDKMEAIKNHKANNQIVGMVGDGINDAPALAVADIGFSMGFAGTDVAIETSDVAIMDDDLRKIPEFIKISRRTNSILKQNIFLAIGIKVIFLCLTLMGMSTMWMAVFADTGASLLVVLNGLRLSR